MREMKDSGIEWIGEIPKSWICCKQKYVIKLINGRAYSDSEFEEDGKYPILRVGNLFSNPVWYSSSMELEPDKFCEKGDLLYSWSMSYAPVIWEGEKVIYHYHIWKTKLTKSLDKKFAYYYLLSLTDALKAETHETTMGFITMGVMNNSYIAFPSIEEQHRISAYLDEKVKEINNAIEKTKETIELYKKYKQAIITEAVTKGLDPNAKMKDSGIDWVKEIPSQWKKIRIKHLFELRNERNYAPLKSVNLLSLYSDIGVIQHDDIEENAISGNKAINADGYKIVYAGDIVDNIILCWMGAIGMSEYNGVTSPAYDVYKPIDETVFTKYFHYLFRTKTFGQKCYTLGRGIMRMRWRVYSEQFMSIYVPVPSFEEQKKIVNFIEAKEKNINNMIEAKEYEITKLQSYKQSLIYEYVTGKKEVK